MTSSAMFLAWSPIRSMALAIHTISSAMEMVRGSSIMKVMSWRRMARNSLSIAMSSRITPAACAASCRAKASSAWRSMRSAMSAAWRMLAKLWTCRRGAASWICFDMRAIFSASSPMRSRSVTVLPIAMMSRRSLAAGWRFTTIWLHSSSMSSSASLTSSSAAITSSIWAVAPVAKAAMAFWICDSTSPPIRRTRERSASSSLSYCLDECSLAMAAPAGSTESPGDVVLGLFPARLHEDLVGHAELHHLAQVHVGGIVRHPRRLLHVMRDDEDRHVLLEIVDQLLDAGRRDRVERRGRLVEEQDLGMGRESARDAKPLLLPAREVEGLLMQPALHLLPQRGAAQRGFDLVLERPPRALAPHAQAVGDVLEDRLGERVGLLEHHADAHAHLDRIHRGAEDVGVVGIQHDLPLVAVARVEVVHPVEAAQEGRFAAAGGPDQRGDLLVVDRHADALQRLERAVVEAEPPRLRFPGRWLSDGNGGGRGCGYHLMFFLSR